ncbi:MAG: type II/IV secretion system protein, partial [Candidatus Saccharimonadales bacterium]
LDEVKRLFNINDSMMPDVHELEVQATKENIGGSEKDQPLASTANAINHLYREHASGCEECNGLGYTGRRGIYEVLSNTNDVQNLIVANATSNDIQAEAIKQGMVTMQLDGLIKAFRGVTSVAEILRVTRE